MGVVIERGVATMQSRGSLPSGYVFKDANGSRTYGAVGHLNDGRALSVNLETGIIGSTRNLDRLVQVLGQFELRLTRKFDTVEHTTRDKVEPFAVYVIGSGQKSTYVNMGQLDDGTFVSVNLASGDVAVNRYSPFKNVTVVGKADFVGKVAR